MNSIRINDLKVGRSVGNTVRNDRVTVVAKAAAPTSRRVSFGNEKGSDVTTTASTTPDGWTVVKGRGQTRPASLTSQANVTTEKRMSPRAHSLV